MLSYFPTNKNPTNRSSPRNYRQRYDLFSISLCIVLSFFAIYFLNDIFHSSITTTSEDILSSSYMNHEPQRTPLKLTRVKMKQQMRIANERTGKKTPNERYEPPRSDHPHECIIQPSYKGLTDQYFPFNSRSFCITSSICMYEDKIYTSVKHASKTTSCRKLSPALSTTINRHTPSCEWIFNHVYCAHGIYSDSEPTRPACPSILSKHLNNNITKSTNDDTIPIIIPSYPHLKNIFHFSYIVGAILQITSNLPNLISNWVHKDEHQQYTQKLKVLLVFKHHSLLPSSLGLWQNEIVNALTANHILSHKIQFESTIALDQYRSSPSLSAKLTPFCTRTAILLGKRVNVNLWPFPSLGDVFITSKKVQIPAQSLYLRYSVYKYTNLSLSNKFTPSMMHEKRILLPFPPRTIRYARRNTISDPLPGEPLKHGPTRRLSDDDELWLVQTMRKISKDSNFTYTEISLNKSTPFAEQVRSFAGAGVIVGLHGANLMNSIFATPLSALVEISALDIGCYRAGANSGLVYSIYVSTNKATVEESSCPLRERKCFQSPNHRRVKIDEVQDREQIEQLTKDAVEHIMNLRSSFWHLGKIPVFKDEEKDSFKIDWNQATR